MKTFEQFSFDPRIQEALAQLKFTGPTPIQSEVIPLVFENKDVVALAQTGMGKTHAYLLPLIQKMIGVTRSELVTVVIVPTKELCDQVLHHVKTISKDLSLMSLGLHGGKSINTELAKLQKGIQLIVATPGRFNDHLRRQTIDLSQIKNIVIDECDKLFEIGLFEQVETILNQTPKTAQKLFFSATMSDEVKNLVDEFSSQYILVNQAGNTVKQTITHTFLPITSELKLDLLCFLLKQERPKKVLVFVRTKILADELASELGARGYTCAALHADKGNHTRKKLLQDFNRGAIKIVIATDLASRGIDVTQITHVINYDMPFVAEDYIHRIGRTGRMTATGISYTFLTEHHDDLRMSENIQELVQEKIKRFRFKEFNYHQKPTKRKVPVTKKKKSEVDKFEMEDVTDEYVSYDEDET